MWKMSVSATLGSRYIQIKLCTILLYLEVNDYRGFLHLLDCSVIFSCLFMGLIFVLSNELI